MGQGWSSSRRAEPAYAQRRLGFSVDCNKECPFLHVKPDFKNKDCLWFDQDFCKDGEAPTEGGAKGYR